MKTLIALLVVAVALPLGANAAADRFGDARREHDARLRLSIRSPVLPARDTFDDSRMHPVLGRRQHPGLGRAYGQLRQVVRSDHLSRPGHPAEDDLIDVAGKGRSRSQ